MPTNSVQSTYLPTRDARQYNGHALGASASAIAEPEIASRPQINMVYGN